jgi:signal transduction histidine kinase
MWRRAIRRVRTLVAVASHSLAGRLLFGAAFIMLVGVGAGAVALPAFFENALVRRFDGDLREHLDALIFVISDDGEGGLSLTEPMAGKQFNSHLSGWYWQITHRGDLVIGSDSLTEYIIRAEIGPDRDRDHYYDLVGPRGEPIRALTRTYGFGEPKKDYVFTITGNRTDLETAIGEFKTIVVVALSALGLVLLAIVFLQVRYGLRPLRRIPVALAAIRTGQSDRLTGSFSVEVQPLAHEINALLDHNAQVIERARTHVGNLAHALKTPLAVLQNEAAAMQGELAGVVRSQADIMREQVEHHLSRARTAARAGIIGARTSVMPILEALARMLEKIYRERNIEISLRGPEAIAFRGEKQDIEEMLGNLMDNACKWAKRRVSAEVGAGAGGTLRIEIGDDGPGVPASQRRAALKRGIRLDEKAPGSGLGLSIVTDTAEIYGGTFEIGDSPLGGMAAILTLPMAEQG